MKTLFLTLVLTLFPFQVQSQEQIEATVEKWDLLRNGNMLITYSIVDKDGVHEFSYQYQVISYAEPVPHCNELTVKEGKMYLITQESFPKQYIIEEIPLNIKEK